MPLNIGTYGSKNDLVQRIRYRLSDVTSATYDFQDNELLSHIQDAVIDYSKYRPNLKQATLALVANTQVYSLPTDLIELSPEFFRYRTSPSLNPDIQTLIVSDLFTAFAHTGDYVVNDIRQDVWERFDNYGEGVWLLNNYNQVVLFPTPVYADTINYWYGAIHIPDPTTGEYITIPTQDYEIVILLTYARCLDIYATDQAKNPETREGQTTVKYTPEVLRTEAHRIRMQMQARLTSNVHSRD